MNFNTLKGFDFAGWLNRKLYVGQLDPWRRTDDGKPLMVLLIPVDTALTYYQDWSGQEIARQDLISYLKLNDILTFRNVDEFQKLKASQKIPVDTRALKPKRKITDEQREKLREHMRNVRKNRKTSEIPSVS